LTCFILIATSFLSTAFARAQSLQSKQARIDFDLKTGMRDRIKISFDEWNLRSWHHPGFPRGSVSNHNEPDEHG